MPAVAGEPQAGAAAWVRIHRHRRIAPFRCEWSQDCINPDKSALLMNRSFPLDENSRFPAWQINRKKRASVVRAPRMNGEGSPFAGSKELQAEAGLSGFSIIYLIP